MWGWLYILTGTGYNTGKRYAQFELKDDETTSSAAKRNIHGLVEF